MSRSPLPRVPLVLHIVPGVVVLATALYAAGFWDKKDFRQWTPKEVEKMYTDSPWAKRVSITLAGPTAGFGADTGPRGGGRSGGGGGIPGGAGGGGRPAGGGGAGQMPPQAPTLTLQVRFEEAAPIKHARVKFNMGESTEPTPAMQQYLDAREPYYVVAVEGLPAILARLEDEPEKLATTARLRRKKKADLSPAKVEVVAQQQRATLKYFFPKADPITLEDKEVEFLMKFERETMAGIRPQRPGAGGQRQAGQGGQGGQRQQAGGRQRAEAGGRGASRAMAIFGKEVKRRFRLKDMVYRGELAL